MASVFNWVLEKTMVSRSALKRRYIPYIEFNENYNYGNSSCLNDVEAQLGYQYILLECDHVLAKKLTAVFQERSFELIVERLAEKLNVVSKQILMLQRQGDYFVFKSYQDAGLSIGFRTLSAKFSPCDGKAWLVHKDIMSTEGAISFLVSYYRIVVDLDTKSVWSVYD